MDKKSFYCSPQEFASHMAASGMPLLTLGTTTIPALGFGTGTTWFKGAQGEDALIASLQAALDMGVRHIDEAEMYANEEVWTRQRGGVWTEWWVDALVYAVGWAGGDVSSSPRPIPDIPSFPHSSPPHCHPLSLMPLPPHAPPLTASLHLSSLLFASGRLSSPPSHPRRRSRAGPSRGGSRARRRPAATSSSRARC